MSRKRDRYSDDLSLTITNLCNATIIDKLIPGALWTLRILMEDEHGEHIAYSLDYLRSGLLYTYFPDEVTEFIQKKLGVRYVGVENFRFFVQYLREAADEFSQRKYNQEMFKDALDAIAGFLVSDLVGRINQRVAETEHEVKTALRKDAIGNFIRDLRAVLTKHVDNPHIPAYALTEIERTIDDCIGYDAYKSDDDE